MKILVISAMWQRHNIAEIMLDHLVPQKKRLAGEIDLDVLMVGSEGQASRALVEDRGWGYIEHENKPVGAKWNAVLHAAKDKQPDAVVVLGSDNFANDAMFLKWKEFMNAGIEYAGILDAYRYGVRTDQLIHWHGYENFRKGESIGPTRCFSHALLDRLGWDMWNEELNRGLDYSATQRLKQFPHKQQFIRMDDSPIKHIGTAVASNICPFVTTSPTSKIDFVDSDKIKEWLGETGERILALSEARDAPSPEMVFQRATPEGAI